MNPSEDPSDRLLDSLLSEQAKGKPDEALLRAISSRLGARDSKRPRDRSFNFVWPAAGAAVVLLAAAGLFWNHGNETAAVIDDRELAVRDHPVKSTDEHGDPLLSEGDGPLPGTEALKPVADDGSRAVGADPDHLLDSLSFILEEDTAWYVQFGFESEGKWAPRIVGKAHDGTRFKNRVAAVEMLSPGDVFFKDLSMAGRFKFLGFTERQVTSERTGITRIAKIGQYEDLKPNKLGVRYESQQSLPRAKIDASAYHDRTAVLELEALGFDGMEFKVEERTWFSLPPGGGEKRFFLEDVRADRIVVTMENPDSTTKTRVIAKGQ